MIFSSKTILVTGGAGYIGSHTVLALQDQGYQIIVLDNLIYGHRELIETFSQVTLIIGDINDSELLNSIFSTHVVAAVIHFAAYAYVGESITDPRKRQKLSLSMPGLGTNSVMAIKHSLN
jgi:UDP-glucose 4-epimerase